MLIFPPSRLQLDRGLLQSVRIAVVAFIVLCVSLCIFFATYPWHTQEVAMQGLGLKQKSGSMLFAYESIGSGGLALHPRHALGWVSRLADELALIAYNSRPDVLAKEAKLLISLKNGKELLTLGNGRTLYLKEAQQGKGLSSSETATALWVKPILLDNGTVLVETGRQLASGEEKGEFIASLQGTLPARYNPMQQTSIKVLKASKGFAQDLLIQKYGGREFSAWRDKIVLEFTRETSSNYACFVSTGDYLLYDEGEWRVVPFSELKNDLPVAQIKSATARGLEIQAWDDTGFALLMVSVEMEKPGRFQLKPETMPSGVRVRSSNAISCALGKRRVIVRQGDWLLKTAAGWRNLRRSEEIEQYLHHRLKGELLIFDGIEKEQGRLVMKGNLFDETRTQTQPFTLAIESEKAQSKTTRKRKTLERRAA